jgi:hypothetical protein
MNKQAVPTIQPDSVSRILARPITTHHARSPISQIVRPRFAERGGLSHIAPNRKIPAKCNAIRVHIAAVRRRGMPSPIRDVGVSTKVSLFNTPAS